MINPHILARFGPKAQQFLTETNPDKAMGPLLYDKILRVKGCHISLIGHPGSGKTRKMHWLVTWLNKLETIVWIDSCKDEEIAPLFFMGKDINIIIPMGGTKIELNPGHLENKKLDKSERKKKENWILPAKWTVRSVHMPSQFWDAIEPDKINIFSIRQYFFDAKQQSKFFAQLFKHLAIRCSEEWFRDKKGIERMSIFVDEAQRMVPSTSFSREPDAIEAAQDVTANVLEMRAYGVRIVMGTQDYMNIYPAARRNMPARIFCHGANVKSDESSLFHRLAKYSERYKIYEGLFVFPDGDYYPKNQPWPFPDFPKPKGAQIRYLGKRDRQTQDDEIEQESMPDLGRFADQAIESERDDIRLPSRYEVMEEICSR